MSILLESRNFGQLTVNDLCSEALVSRAAFYSHFYDKYDFLKYWLTNIKLEITKNDGDYRNMEKTVNEFVHQNRQIIKNVVENANYETMKLLCHCILFNPDVTGEENKNNKMNLKHIALSSYYAGGILHYLFWQVENKFPEDAQMMNQYFYDITQYLLKWEPNEDIDMLH